MAARYRDPPDPEWDEGDDLEDDAECGESEKEDATDACPYCGEEIYDDAEWCPHCQQYLSRETSPRSPLPTWVWVGLAASALAVLLWIVLG